MLGDFMPEKGRETYLQKSREGKEVLQVGATLVGKTWRNMTYPTPCSTEVERESPNTAKPLSSVKRTLLYH